MPFKSAAQRRYLFAEHPEVAKKYAADGGGTPKKIQQGNLSLSPKDSFDAPKWSKNPWGEMLKRKGISNLNKATKGF